MWFLYVSICSGVAAAVGLMVEVVGAGLSWILIGHQGIFVIDHTDHVTLVKDSDRSSLLIYYQGQELICLRSVQKHIWSWRFSGKSLELYKNIHNLPCQSLAFVVL